MRVVLDSTLRTPLDARVLRTDAATTVITTERSDPERRAALRRLGTRVEVVDADAGRVSLTEALTALRRTGTESVLVEGGAATITSLLAAGLVDRVIVSISPVVIGRGTEAIDALGIRSIADAIRLEHRTLWPLGDDLVMAGDVAA